MLFLHAFAFFIFVIHLLLTLSYRKMGGLQREKEEKEEFIHPLPEQAWK